MMMSLKHIRNVFLCCTTQSFFTFIISDNEYYLLLQLLFFVMLLLSGIILFKIVILVQLYFLSFPTCLERNLFLCIQFSDFPLITLPVKPCKCYQLHASEGYHAPLINCILVLFLTIITNGPTLQFKLIHMHDFVSNFLIFTNNISHLVVFSDDGSSVRVPVQPFRIMALIQRRLRTQTSSPGRKSCVCTFLSYQSLNREAVTCNCFLEKECALSNRLSNTSEYALGVQMGRSLFPSRRSTSQRFVPCIKKSDMN